MKQSGFAAEPVRACTSCCSPGPQAGRPPGGGPVEKSLCDGVFLPVAGYAQTTLDVSLRWPDSSSMCALRRGMLHLSSRNWYPRGVGIAASVLNAAAQGPL